MHWGPSCKQRRQHCPLFLNAFFKSFIFLFQFSCTRRPSCSLYFLILRGKHVTLCLHTHSVSITTTGKEPGNNKKKPTKFYFPHTLKHILKSIFIGQNLGLFKAISYRLSNKGSEISISPCALAGPLLNGGRAAAYTRHFMSVSR